MSNVAFFIPNATLSFPHLFEARSVQGGTPRFSGNLLIKPAVNPDHNQVMQAINAGRAQILAESFAGKVPGRDLPMKNGEVEYPGNEAYAGVFIIRAASTSRPQVVDGNVQPVIDASMFYPGCVVNASITIYAYKLATGNGITFGLEAIQFVGDGPRLDNRPDASSIFQPVAGGGVAGVEPAAPQGGSDFSWMS